MERPDAGRLHVLRVFAMHVGRSTLTFSRDSSSSLESSSSSKIEWLLLAAELVQVVSCCPPTACPGQQAVFAVPAAASAVSVSSSAEKPRGAAPPACAAARASRTSAALSRTSIGGASLLETSSPTKLQTGSTQRRSDAGSCPNDVDSADECSFYASSTAISACMHEDQKV